MLPFEGLFFVQYCKGDTKSSWCEEVLPTGYNIVPHDFEVCQGVKSI